MSNNRERGRRSHQVRSLAELAGHAIRSDDVEDDARRTISPKPLDLQNQSAREVCVRSDST
jgi:hypothetical protein